MANGRQNEQKLVKLYMDLTGTNEAGARSVFMYVCARGEGANSSNAISVPESTPLAQPFTVSPPPKGRQALALLLALAAFCASANASPTTNSFITSPISLTDAVNIALHQNPTILEAQKNLEATQGVVVQTRAVALPTISATGSYNALQPSDVDTFSLPPSFTETLPPGSSQTFNFGTSQNWVSQFKLMQSFYQGGRLLSSFRVARLTREQALFNYQATVADTVLSVELAYFDVLLAVQQIKVQEASVQLLTQQLADTTRRYEAGTVPRFNVLRAEVELANARPPLIAARNSLRISKNNLSNLLGFNLPRQTLENIPLTLSGKLEALPLELRLPQAIAMALERRPELGSFRKAYALRKEDIINAKAGYKPSLQGYIGYDIHNNPFRSNLTDDNHGWIAGAQLTWTVFDGLRTQGRLTETRALYERAGIELEDEGRRIELEVRTDYSNFIEAKEVLESQKKVIEQAVEALRLASARYEAGTGTQLDVLSAQTALTDARATQAQALHDYDAARARLERAVGMIVPEQTGK